MMRRPIFFTLALILITLSFGAQTLSATTDPLTFASFSQQQFNQQTFHLANNGVIGVNKGVTFNSTLAVDEFPSSVACCSSTSLGRTFSLTPTFRRSSRLAAPVRLLTRIVVVGSDVSCG
jgi:hypothetical protein